jgi:hypothetical protein
MRTLPVRLALVAFLALALGLPLGAAAAQQICETPPDAVACLPFPCLAVDAQAAPVFGCSIPIPPCGMQVPPVVAGAPEAPSDAVLCDCPSPCMVIDCLPPIEGRLSWRGCPIAWELP